MACFYSRIEFEYCAETVKELADHRVSSVQVMPEGVLIEIVLAEWMHSGAGGEGDCLAMSGVLLPRMLNAGFQTHHLSCSERAACIRSSEGASGTTNMVRMAALFDNTSHRAPDVEGSAMFVSTRSWTWTPEEAYRLLETSGLSVSRSMRRLTAVGLAQGADCSARAEGAAKGARPESGMPTTAVVLDCALQMLKLCSRALGEPFRQVGYIDRVDFLCPQGLDAVCDTFNLSAQRRACGVWTVRVADTRGKVLLVASGVQFWDEDVPDLHLESALIQQSTHGLEHLFGLRLGSDDNLVEHGLSSMNLVGLLNLYVTMYGFAPEAGEWRAEPTLGRASRLQAQRLRLGGAQGHVDVQSDASYDELGDSPLTHIEARLVYLERHAGVAPAYNEAVMVDVEEGLSLVDVQDRLAVLVRSHGGLRTTFPSSVGAPRRSVAPPGVCRVRAVTLGERDISAEETRALVRSFVREPFDLESGPLLRVGLLAVRSGAKRLVVVAHHTICDGHTMAAVVLPSLLGGFVENTSHSWSMSKYTQVQAKNWDAARLEVALAHWDTLLDGAPRSLRLPGDHPRPSVQSHQGECHAFELKGPTCCGLRELAKSAKVTPFVGLLGATALVIAKWSGERRFSLAVPVSLRTDPALERTVGCLVNTLPVMVEVNSEQCVFEFLSGLQQSLVDTLRYPDLPLDALVQRAKVRRDLAENPLLQVAFGYREEAAGTNVSSVHSGTSKYDLTVYFRSLGQRVVCELEYATDLFSSERISWLASQLESSIHALHDAPSMRLSELKFDSATISALSGQPAVGRLESVDLDLRAHDFAASAFSVIEASSQLASRRDVSDLIRTVLVWIEEQSYSNNFVVGLCFDRSVAWVAAMLAVLRAGGCFVPVDIRVPPERALRLMADASADLLICDSSLCSWAGEFHGAVFDGESGRALQQIESEFEATFERGSRAELGGRYLTYGISTSGSTGEPKAACVYDSGVENLLHWYRETLEVCPLDVILVATSTAFDLTQKNVLVAAAVGARLVLAEGGVFDPRHLVSAIENHGVTVFNCTPTMFLAVLTAAGPEFSALTTLRWVILGGEVLRAAPLQAWLTHRCCNARVMNTYGPTECSDVVAAYVVDPKTDVVGPVPLGRAIQNVGLRVVDSVGDESMAGAVGELCIDGVAKGAGYLADAARTRVSFDCRFGYLTGDHVRLGEDGLLHYVGRKDGQIKVRGQRVHFAEIECALVEHPAVADVAVAQVETESGDLLLGFLVPRQGFEERAVRLFAGERLPSYMVPQIFEIEAKLPVTGTGKVDRGELAKMANRCVASRKVIMRAGNHGARLDHPLVAMMAEVLCIPDADIGPHDDFFELGGNSLLAVTFCEMLERRLNVTLRPIDLVRYPTLNGIQDLVGSRQASNSS